MRIFAIDPGTERSAFVILEPDHLTLWRRGHIPNDRLLELIDNVPFHPNRDIACVIERIESYGMAVGREIFETCFWTGRFMERWFAMTSETSEANLLPRREVKLFLCSDSRAKDPNIRQALIDRFGPGKAKAIGTKKEPGPLYDVKGDIWSALAVAVTFAASIQTLQKTG